MWLSCIGRRLRVRKNQPQAESLLLRALLSHMRLHDPDTFTHARNVARLVHPVARRLLPPRAAREATLAALLHDVGKVFLAPALIRKAGPLTRTEWLLVEAHAAAGARLLRTCPSLAPVARLVRHHHERWDGRGYPDRLRGRRIPLGARLIALADSLDAITSPRPYAPARSAGEAEAELRANAGTQFDPALVEVFLAMLPDAAGQKRAAPPGGSFVSVQKVASAPTGSFPLPSTGATSFFRRLHRKPPGGPSLLRLAAGLAGATGITAAAVSLALAARGPAPATPASPAAVSPLPTFAAPPAPVHGRASSRPERPALPPADPPAAVPPLPLKPPSPAAEVPPAAEAPPAVPVVLPGQPDGLSSPLPPAPTAPPAVLPP